MKRQYGREIKLVVIDNTKYDSRVLVQKQRRKKLP